MLSLVLVAVDTCTLSSLTKSKSSELVASASCACDARGRLETSRTERMDNRRFTAHSRARGPRPATSLGPSEATASALARSDHGYGRPEPRGRPQRQSRLSNEAPSKLQRVLWRLQSELPMPSLSR